VTPEDFDGREALRAVYRILERVRPDERIAFTLRHLQGMSLQEIAEACEVSVPTIKRRLSRAQRSFARRAGAEPSLAARLELDPVDGRLPALRRFRG
jgi:RNA polymerase sigma-70 factor (ECF subfamily)